jgi:hypothetical protein
MPQYGIGMDRIVSVHQLVSNAIILDGQETGDDDEDNAGAESARDTEE